MNMALMSKAQEVVGDLTSSERLSYVFLTRAIAKTSEAKTEPELIGLGSCELR